MKDRNGVELQVGDVCVDHSKRTREYEACIVEVKKFINGFVVCDDTAKKDKPTGYKWYAYILPSDLEIIGDVR